MPERVRPREREIERVGKEHAAWALWQPSTVAVFSIIIVIICAAGGRVC